MASAMRGLWQSGFSSHNIFFRGREWYPLWSRVASVHLQNNIFSTVRVKICVGKKFAKKERKEVLVQYQYYLYESLQRTSLAFLKSFCSAYRRDWWTTSLT
jgi:hypothetical protein